MYDISFDDRTQELEQILRELKESVKEIDACAVVSIEGLPIAANMPDIYDDTIVAAMTSAMLTLGEKIATNLRRGSLNKVSVEGVDGQVISQAAGTNAVLTISASKEAKLGLIFMEMDKATQKIASLLG